ncbi:MAG: flagellar hook-basal body protein [Candidatus Poribacteria bacterium]
MWTSVSGASSRLQSVDMIANNLANSDTIGFKKDNPTFKEYLASLEREHEGVDIPRGPVKDKDLYPLDGRDQSFVVVDGTYTDFKSGATKVTQSPLDIALGGAGFLEILTPAGLRYSRNGSLKISADGVLVTSDGSPVLSSHPGGLAARQPANEIPNGIQRGVTAESMRVMSEVSRYINLRDRKGPISINENGEIYSGDDFVAKLSVIEFIDKSKLRKAGGQSFENKDIMNISTDPVRTKVYQGVIETSNVNPIEEMTNLIKANRLFEHDMKVLKTYGELLGKEANDIGKL